MNTSPPRALITADHTPSPDFPLKPFRIRHSSPAIPADAARIASWPLNCRAT